MPKGDPWLSSTSAEDSPYGYITYCDGGVTVKRVMISGKSILLRPENQHGHTPALVDPSADRIIAPADGRG